LYREVIRDESDFSKWHVGEQVALGSLQG